MLIGGLRSREGGLLDGRLHGREVYLLDIGSQGREIGLLEDGKGLDGLMRLGNSRRSFTPALSKLVAKIFEGDEVVLEVA